MVCQQVADNNSAAVCLHHTSSACHIQKISIPKCDGHTYIQTQNEVRSRISCLMLRHLAIMIFPREHTVFLKFDTKNLSTQLFITLVHVSVENTQPYLNMYMHIMVA